MIILYMFCILQLQSTLLTRASKSSTDIILIQSHAISIKYRSWQEGSRYTTHFITTHSYPYICCLELCDRNSIISAYQFTGGCLIKRCSETTQWEREKMIFQKTNSRTPSNSTKVTKLSSLPRLL